MAPVGPLHFVARQASAWIMTFYILATSFVTSVEWTDLEGPDVDRIRYPTLVTELRLSYKSYKTMSLKEELQ